MPKSGHGDEPGQNAVSIDTPLPTLVAVWSAVTVPDADPMASSSSGYAATTQMASGAEGPTLGLR